MDALLNISHLPYFKTSLLKTLYPAIKLPSLYQKISRWIEAEVLVELKKGVYTTNAYFEKHRSDSGFPIFIANILRYPSYVSGSYVLQRHDILTEITYPITSVTVKSSRTYSNKLGDFVYSSISESLYKGFLIEEYEGNNIYMATKAKALFDYLYFKYLKTPISPLEIKERERLDIESFTKRDIQEFSHYCSLTRVKYLKKLTKPLFYA